MENNKKMNNNNKRENTSTGIFKAFWKIIGSLILVGLVIAFGLGIAGLIARGFM